MKRVFIIHGYEGRPEGGWKPWLKKKLEEKGFFANVPVMPNPDHPKLQQWLGCMEKNIGTADQETFLVGHSLGCQTIIQYLSRLSPNIKIGGVVFVSGLPSFENQAIKEFYVDSGQIRLAKEKCEKFVTIFSDNDKYVPLDKSEEFAKELVAKKFFVKGKGHFSDDDGVFELPELLQEILEISK
jgi:hypothetical protein